MQDEIRSLESRLRKLQAEILAATRDQTGVCRRFVGKVYNVGTLPASGDRYFLTHPVTLAGNETENTTPTIVVNTSISTPVLIIGPAPAVNDYVVANLIERTWIAERWYVDGGSGLTVPVAGCICTSAPSSMSCTVSYVAPTTAASTSHVYQDCTLAYFSTAPPYMPSTAFPGAGFYSAAAWTDDFGIIDYFRLSCFGSQWSIGIGQYSGGLWQAPGQIYNWAIRTAHPEDGNTCTPFLLSVGSAQPGFRTDVKFTISG